MPIFTVETTYHMPVYRQRSYRAATPEKACRLAVDDDDWEDAKEDVDTSGETYVTVLLKGRNAAYFGKDVAIPDAFGETVQRKAALFDDLVAIPTLAGLPSVQVAFVNRPPAASRPLRAALRPERPISTKQARGSRRAVGPACPQACFARSGPPGP